MKLLIYKLIYLILALSCLAQMRIEETIVVRAEMITEDGRLDLTAYKRGQDLIRATIQDKSGRFGVDVIHKDGRIHTIERLDEETRVHELTGDEAATHLLDLLALTPRYHFDKSNIFNLKTPVFRDYRVDFISSEEDNESVLPSKLRLYKKTNDTEVLIREIIYSHSSRQPQKHTLELWELELRDLVDGKNGNIVLKKMDYNAGVPMFLFSIPDVPAR